MANPDECARKKKSPWVIVFEKPRIARHRVEKVFERLLGGYCEGG
jgi:hypothetical protein